MKKLLSILFVSLFLATVVLPLASCVRPGPTADQPSTSDNPFFTTDQTGHPEVSADAVDVEELLKVDPNYSTKRDYEIRFKSRIPEVDYSNLPHVTLHEGHSKENGLALVVAENKTPRYFKLDERDCWLMDFWDQTNQFTITPDADTVKAWKGKEFSLNLICHVTQVLSVTVHYTDAQGNVQGQKVSSKITQNFHTLSFNFDALAMRKGVSFTFTCEGPDITRLTAAYLSVPVEARKGETGLIHSKFEQSFYTVADANVIDFGATGNGITDDTQAFLDAIAYVETLGGGTVFVPAGYYCLTSSLYLAPGVGLIGELEKGTANGTVLCIYGGKGETDPFKAAVAMHVQSAVMNIAFWYPEQTFVNGTPIPYPPTIFQLGVEGFSVHNVTFVNSYFGIHCDNETISSNSCQSVRDVYGTCLTVGYYNHLSLDIGKLENVNFSPDIWIASGLPGSPNPELLRTWMIRNAKGMWIRRVDWTMWSDITIEGCRIGILFGESPIGTTNGHAYNIHIQDCFYGIYTESLWWLLLTNSTISCTGGEGATPLYLLESDVVESKAGTLSLHNCILTTTGANAITSYSDAALVMSNCMLISASATTYANTQGTADLLINSTISGNQTGHSLLNIENTPAPLENVNYNKTVITKPDSDAFIHMGKEYGIVEGEEISEKLQSAIDRLKGQGGTIYIPVGNFRLERPIEVWEGIELRGVLSWPQARKFSNLLTDFGRGDPDGEALITLHSGAGMRGLCVTYDKQDTTNFEEYSYTIRGRGEDIYLVDMSLPTSWRGVDFASYRCDRHYIDYLWMSALDIGIAVGAGSEDGLIRDCSVTLNAWSLRDDENWWQDVDKLAMSQLRPYVIGESKNQILWNNGVFAAARGVSIEDGAQNVYLIGHGVDAGFHSAHFSGNCTVYMVNSQLVNRHDTDATAKMSYVVTDETFTGTITMVNSALWGYPSEGMVLNGSGNITLYNTLALVSGAPFCRQNAGNAALYGTLVYHDGQDFILGRDAVSLTISGNYYPDGVQYKKNWNSDATISGTDLTS